jgi:hypothetical protein
LKAWFKDFTFCFTTFSARPSTGAQRSHEPAPKNKKEKKKEKKKDVKMTLEDQKFVNKFKVSFVCIPEDV